VLSNQPDGVEKIRTALASRTIILPYCKPGFALAKASASALESDIDACGMVWMQHGIVTWGDTAQEAYSRMIELVSLAERFTERNRCRPVRVVCPTPVEVAMRRAERVAPIVRGVLVGSAEDATARRGAIVLTINNSELLDVVNAEGAKDLLTSPLLTTDHLIRTKPLPLWLDVPDYDDDLLAQRLREGIERYEKQYSAYCARHSEGSDKHLEDHLPRLILMPGVGAFAVGPDSESAVITRDIAVQNLLAKASISAMGAAYQALPERELYRMEYDPFQRAKLEAKDAGRTALVTGAAGAIGSGICEELLQQGCAVALGDLPGERLTTLVDELAAAHGPRVIAAPFDVTERSQVASAFGMVSRAWGGLDLAVINAGVAHVAQLVDLDVDSFRGIERVNVDGTLNLIAESARHFRLQNCGGDIVLISTKNVFAPGAGFGAYSATKAAAHQLARIASLELACMGVRINMVAPDAVFSHGSRRSGLWEAVGPERMRARGLDEKGLESYYQNRNLLKARVTARHVANAVIYFATRQTPTTGATIPVDGGLPDATPR
jgi:NAD(P)-dependent dehydrogenase (short-subunit alcohol dehydrogenase family)